MDNPKYYEEFDWAEMPEKHILEKVKLFFELIPEDVNTILDLGCGNGIITNQLAKKFDVTGTDRSAEALNFVKTKKVRCNCNELPFADNSFDLVVSSEMLEHLEENVYLETIAEISRVSKKYVLISVPNNEHIQRDLIQCPQCRHVYNLNYHQRSISLQALSHVFSEFKVIHSTTCGRKVKPSFSRLTKWKHKFAPSYSWMPTYWTKKRSRKTLCPACDHSFVIPFKHHPVSFLYDVITFLFSKSRDYWLIVLFEKKNVGL